MTGEPRRVGVLGVGLMGERMLAGLERDARFAAAGGFDPDRTRLVAAAERFGFQAHATEDELLARDDLDLVYIASPPGSHVPSALAAIARGHPVYLEKPLAASVADAERLVAAVEECGARAVMHFPFSTLPVLPRIERESRTGIAGTWLRVEIALSFSAWPRTWHTAGPWLAGRAEGGFLREVFSHFAYLTHRLLGPTEVVSVARPDRGAAAPTIPTAHGENETAIVATLRTREEAPTPGIPITLTGAVGGAAPDFNRWTLYGTERSYRLENWRKTLVSDGGEWEELTPDDPNIPPERRGQLAGLAAWLEGDPHPLPSVREGLEVVRVVEALREN